MRTAPPVAPAPTPATPAATSDAILAALAYSDVFNWPLSAAEIHSLLPARAEPADVAEGIATLTTAGRIAQIEDLFVLRGRTEIADDRRRRELISARLWPTAIRYGRWIAAMPFVSMVAVSGSLAVNAAESDADIDFFVVTEDGRLWTTRALIVGVVRAAAIDRFAATLCPNYLITASNVELAERDVFTARELAQLVPLYGGPALDQLLERNNWFREFLPNHPGPQPRLEGVPPAIGRRVTPLLRRRAFDRLERWEMDRKVARLTALVADPALGEARFDERACKGHLDGHRGRVLDAYAERLHRLGVDA